MIRGHVALIRQLRAFMEGSALPWTQVKFNTAHDDDGRPFYDDHRCEVSFLHHGTRVNIVIFAPSTERIEGVEPLPNGRLAARCGNEVIRGPIDTATWDAIMKLINQETLCQ